MITALKAISIASF